MNNEETKTQKTHVSPADANTLLPAVDSTVVYLEDCVQALKRFDDNYFDVAIVDPPYGIGFDGHSQIIGKSGKSRGFSDKKLYSIKDWDKERPDANYFSELIRVSKNQIVWGGNYFADLLPPKKGWIYWDKKPNGENLTFSDGELAWTSFDKPLKMYSYAWIGFGMVNSGEKKIHPTQKPVALYDWIIQNYCADANLLLDTHVGSGSSRIAAAKAGKQFIGFEIDPEYYEKQEKRFNDWNSQLRMF